jgi:hypothetical protein
MPMEVDPALVEAAAWLGNMTDFLVIPCKPPMSGWTRSRRPPAGRCSA